MKIQFILSSLVLFHLVVGCTKSDFNLSPKQNRIARARFGQTETLYVISGDRISVLVTQTSSSKQFGRCTLSNSNPFCVTTNLTGQIDNTDSCSFTADMIRNTGCESKITMNLEGTTVPPATINFFANTTAQSGLQIINRCPYPIDIFLGEGPGVYKHTVPAGPTPYITSTTQAGKQRIIATKSNTACQNDSSNCPISSTFWAASFAEYTVANDAITYDISAVNGFAMPITIVKPCGSKTDVVSTGSMSVDKCENFMTLYDPNKYTGPIIPASNCPSNATTAPVTGEQSPSNSSFCVRSAVYPLDTKGGWRLSNRNPPSMGKIYGCQSPNRFAISMQNAPSGIYTFNSSVQPQDCSTQYNQTLCSWVCSLDPTYTQDCNNWGKATTWYSMIQKYVTNPTKVNGYTIFAYPTDDNKVTPFCKSETQNLIVIFGPVKQGDVTAGKVGATGACPTEEGPN